MTVVVEYYNESVDNSFTNTFETVRGAKMFMDALTTREIEYEVSYL